MMNENDIPKPKYWRGSEALYSFEDVDDVLKWCIENNVGILGFEGFEKVSDKYTPNMDWIADLSSVYKKNKHNFNVESIELVRSYLSELPCNILLEFEFIN